MKYTINIQLNAVKFDTKSYQHGIMYQFVRDMEQPRRFDVRVTCSDGRSWPIWDELDDIYIDGRPTLSHLQKMRRSAHSHISRMERDDKRIRINPNPRPSWSSAPKWDDEFHDAPEPDIDDWADDERLRRQDIGV